MYKGSSTGFVRYSKTKEGRKITRMKLQEAIEYVKKEIGRELTEEEIKTLKRYRSLARQGYRVWLQEWIEKEE